MVKQGITNFFKNLKYVFTPLGTLFVGMLFGVCFLTAGFKTQINYASTQIQAITEESNIDVSNLKNIAVDSFTSLDWSDPITAVKTIASKDWIQNTLIANLKQEIENYEEYAHAIEGAVKDAVKGYAKYVALFAVCCVLGLFAGILLTKMLIRHDIAKRSFLKYFLISLANSTVITALIGLCLWLSLLWKPNIFISSVLLIILAGIGSLLEAYWIHGRKKVELKEVVNIKNVMLLFVSNILIYLIAVAISALVYVITNALVALFIVLALFTVATAVISMNAEAYVKSLAAKTPPESPEKAKTDK